MPLLTARTCTVFISTGKGTRVFSSMADIPADLRKRMDCVTETETLLLADRRGKEEVVRAFSGAPSSFKYQGCRRLSDRLTDGIAVAPPPEPDPPAELGRDDSGACRRWLEFLVPVAMALSLWLLLDTTL